MQLPPSYEFVNVLGRPSHGQGVPYPNNISADSLPFLGAEAAMQALQAQCACLGASTSGRFALRVGPAKPHIRGAQPCSKRQRRAWLVQATAGVTTCLL